MSERRIKYFIGIDLGGARGKSTAVAKLSRSEYGVSVESVYMRTPDGARWNDQALLGYLQTFSPEDTAIAINAPLTQPACVRCVRQQCPGADSCSVQATVWLRNQGQELQMQAVLSDRNRIAATPQGSGFRQPESVPAAARQPLPPYTHRCTEVIHHYQTGLLPKEHLGQSSWAIATRATFLCKAVRQYGFTLNESLLEVSPRCTIHALFGAASAIGYKRDADPWQTRASIVDGMSAMSFAATSRLSKEDVLRNDNCFDALICGYTAFLWARDGWTLPQSNDGDDDNSLFREDGWIWAPPVR